MNTSNRKNLFILSFTMLVVMLGYSLAMPLLPFYVERFGVGGTELGWLMATYSLMQLICAPIWGIASDRYGRKPASALGHESFTTTAQSYAKPEAVGRARQQRVLKVLNGGAAA